jgi:hypothetical protein
MADRSTAKSKRAEAAPATGKGSLAGGLTAENARLKAELAEARQHITDLELKQAEIVNRIDWVIDSLHNLVE